MIICPSCEGRKGSIALVMIASKGCVERWMPCSFCKGAGEVLEERSSWRNVGEAMRMDRLARDMSQREEAKRLGISVVEYSQMEAGMIEPMDYEAIHRTIEGLTS